MGTQGGESRRAVVTATGGIAEDEDPPAMAILSAGGTRGNREARRVTKIFSLRGLTAEDVAEALEIAKEIAAHPNAAAWARHDLQSGELVALVVELPD